VAFRRHAITVTRDYNRGRLVVICKWISQRYVTCDDRPVARREARRGFQDYVFPLARRIKTIRVRYAQNLQITRGLLRPSRPAVAVCTFKHARQLIQPAMLQTGVSTLSSFEAHADIMFATASPGKYWAEWKTGRQQTGRPITRTNGPPSSPLGVNGVRDALLCLFDYSDDLSVSRPLFSIPHPCHNALPSSINRHSYFYFRIKKKEISVSRRPLQ